MDSGEGRWGRESGLGVGGMGDGGKEVRAPTRLTASLPCRALNPRLSTPLKTPTGIDTTHPDLAANIHPLVGYNALANNSQVADDTGHGTGARGGGGEGERGGEGEQWCFQAELVRVPSLCSFRSPAAAGARPAHRPAAAPLPLCRPGGHHRGRGQQQRRRHRAWPAACPRCWESPT